jgi:hypothetical protein
MPMVLPPSSFNPTFLLSDLLFDELGIRCWHFLVIVHYQAAKLWKK